MSPKKLALGAAAVALAGAAVLFLFRREDPALAASLRAVTADYRLIIVLMDGADSLDDGLRARCTAAGRIIFYRKQRAIDEIGAKLAGNRRAAAQVARYLEREPGLHDADKLAFLDLADNLDPALRDQLLSIQLAYREEVTRIFSQFETRGASGSRERWDAYVAALRKGLSREQILAGFGDVLPEEPEADTRGAPGNEFFGNDFDPKTVALTFDDGPHPKYTEQVLALLRKYGIRACFFELGTNLGTVDASGKVTLSRNAEIAKKVLAAGHLIANHSYSHPVLPKLPEPKRTEEIDETSALLTQVAGRKPELFRAPYGARNHEILQQVNSEGLRSVMWNIDSLDWADPIPESIAMRVLHEITRKQKGIILFHDIHKQGVMALSPVIEELMRQNYTFVSYDKGQFTKTQAPEGMDRSPAPVTTISAQAPGSSQPYYRESWAVIVGINDYQKWPKLRYAVNDAKGIEEALVTRFGFKRENIRKLLNGDATRQRIMEVLGDEFTDGRKVQREDRVFSFSPGTAPPAPSRTAGNSASSCRWTRTFRITTPPRSA